VNGVSEHGFDLPESEAIHVSSLEAVGVRSERRVDGVVKSSNSVD